jgi:hypothetical protein
MGFTQSQHEHAMYRRSSGNNILLVGVYVDDLVEEFKEEMKRVFLTSDLGFLSYLGIEVRQDVSAITLRQMHYARNHVYHEHNKHIDLRYHFIQNCLADKTISATYINTVDQLADILMKALERVKSQELRVRIGMVQVGRDRDQGEIDRGNPLSWPCR